MLTRDEYNILLNEEMYKEIYMDMCESYILLLNRILNQKVDIDKLKKMKEEENEIYVEDKLQNVLKMLLFEVYNEYSTLNLLIEKFYYAYWNSYSLDSKENKDKIIELLDIYDMIENSNLVKSKLDVSKELQRLVKEEKYILAIDILKEIIYANKYRKLLNHKGVKFELYDDFEELSRKVSISYSNYSKAVTMVESSLIKDTYLGEINSLMNCINMFYPRRKKMVSKEIIERYIEDYFYTEVYDEIRDCLIELFLNVLGKNEEYEEDNDKLFNYLLLIIYEKYGDLKDVLLEMYFRMNINIDKNSDENNEPNLRRMLELLDIIKSNNFHENRVDIMTQAENYVCNEKYKEANLIIKELIYGPKFRKMLNEKKVYYDEYDNFNELYYLINYYYVEKKDKLEELKADNGKEEYKRLLENINF